MEDLSNIGSNLRAFEHFYIEAIADLAILRGTYPWIILNQLQLVALNLALSCTTQLYTTIYKQFVNIVHQATEIFGYIQYQLTYI